jgi:diguanylate cyclase (GGDEF)-like protein
MATRITGEAARRCSRASAAKVRSALPEPTRGRRSARLRAACADAPLDCAGVTVNVTCSFGVAQFGGEMSKLEDLMRAADAALYRAKGWGRNRVCAEG